MSEMIGPDGQPPTFTGAAWVSKDGRYWWNGIAWQPIVAKRGPNWAMIGIAVAIVAVIAYVVIAYPRPIVDTTAYGASNATIDSSTQIEFDYRAQDSCNNLTFVYTFYNAQGIKVGEFQDEQPSHVTAGHSYHFTITAAGGDQIDPSATRFTATPTCHD
ncbi:MAG TPA: hypothetical protein VFO75_00095 [Candidatus Dormibacteraeota bacterium]|nr:hypothetical protein [Candidatus Dormibacteraeota bacterium]